METDYRGLCGMQGDSGHQGHHISTEEEGELLLFWDICFQSMTSFCSSANPVKWVGLNGYILRVEELSQ